MAPKQDQDRKGKGKGKSRGGKREKLKEVRDIPYPEACLPFSCSLTADGRVETCSAGQAEVAAETKSIQDSQALWGVLGGDNVEVAPASADEEEQCLRFLLWAQQEDLVNVVSRKVPDDVVDATELATSWPLSCTVAGREVWTHDISPHRTLEDDLYQMSEELQQKLRRGMSVVEVRGAGKPGSGVGMLAPDGASVRRPAEEALPTPVLNVDVRVRMLRKGLSKFFDLDLVVASSVLNVPFARTLIGADDEVNEEEADGSCEQSAGQVLAATREAALVKAALVRAGADPTKSVRLTVEEKLNGENAQIAWCAAACAWVCCSKNVTILARTVEELDCKEYQEPRFNVALEVAHVWFSMLDCCVGRLEAGSASATAAAQADFATNIRSLLGAHTLVGEMLGSHEHLVNEHLERPQLVFYALVPLFGGHLCVDPIRAEELLTRAGLQCVATSAEGSAPATTRTGAEYLAACKALASPLALKGLQPLAKWGNVAEGGVLYASYVDSTTGAAVPFCLFKIKSVHYRAFRSVREKVNAFVAKLTRKEAEAAGQGEKVKGEKAKGKGKGKDSSPAGQSTSTFDFSPETPLVKREETAEWRKMTEQMLKGLETALKRGPVLAELNSGATPTQALVTPLFEASRRLCRNAAAVQLKPGDLDGRFMSFTLRLDAEDAATSSS